MQILRKEMADVFGKQAYIIPPIKTLKINHVIQNIGIKWVRNQNFYSLKRNKLPETYENNQMWVSISSLNGSKFSSFMSSMCPHLNILETLHKFLVARRKMRYPFCISSRTYFCKHCLLTLDIINATEIKWNHTTKTLQS